METGDVQEAAKKLDVIAEEQWSLASQPNLTKWLQFVLHISTSKYKK